jgi:CubicO group peptidase (beta-lactamase class C family)
MMKQVVRERPPGPIYRIAGALPLMLIAAAVTLVGSNRPPSAIIEENTYWPGREWRTSSPEAQGLDSGILADAFDYIRKHSTRIHSLTIVRNGYVVLDTTFFPFQPDLPHDVASVTKSITTTLIGVAIADRKLTDVNQLVVPLFFDRAIRNRDDRKDRLTLEHLLTMSSSLDCQYNGGEPTLREMRASSDWVQFMLDRPMLAEPGRRSEYCSGGMHLLSGVVSKITGASAFEYAKRRLFQPLGIRSASWPADPNGVTHGWGDLRLKPLDMARIGYLWLNGGRWANQQLIARSWMTSAIQPHAHVLTGDYGYGLWLNRELPLFEANGRGGQRITVLPERHMVLAITGGAFEPGEVGTFILKAIKSEKALPANPAARRRLQEAIRAAHEARSGGEKPFPANARSISGRRYSLDANPLEWRAVTFRFENARKASVSIQFNDRVETRPIGVDGTRRVSPGGRFGLPVAVEGHWEGSNVFVLDYDEVANINSFVCRFTFEGQTVLLDLKERSGELDIKLRGRAE